MRCLTGWVCSMKQEVGGGQHGAAVARSADVGKGKGERGVQAQWADWTARLARGDGPDGQFELISRFRKI
jgi:hypothetical protein